jgi:hypothetical protein
MRLANYWVNSAPERLTACLHVTLPTNVAVADAAETKVGDDAGDDRGLHVTLLARAVFALRPFFPCGRIASITGDLG